MAKIKKDSHIMSFDEKIYLDDKRIEKENIAELNTNNMKIYGMNINLARVFPEVHDGLKLVERRIFFTMYDSRTRLAQDVVMQVKSYFKDLVFNTIIPRNIRLSEAPSHGLPICKYDPECVGARSYAKLSEEVIHRG